MNAGRLGHHLRAKDHSNCKSNLQYFETLKINFEKRAQSISIFTAQTAFWNRMLETSFGISLLVAKNILVGPEIFMKTKVGPSSKNVETTDVKVLLDFYNNVVGIIIHCGLCTKQRILFHRKAFPNKI